MGDGDCGTTLLAGAQAAYALTEQSGDSLSSLSKGLMKLASAVRSGMGGTSGALYGIFLNSFVSNGSRRHSGLVDGGSRPNSVNFDRRSFSNFSGFGPGDSPAYSPQGGYSPVPSNYLEEDHNSLPGDQAGSWAYGSG